MNETGIKEEDEVGEGEITPLSEAQMPLEASPTAASPEEEECPEALSVQEKPSFFRRRVNIALPIAVSAAAVLLIGVAGVALGLQVSKTDRIEKQAAVYKTALMSTEDGKRELEQANEQLNSRNQDLGQQASNANQKAEDADRQAADANQKAEDAGQQASDAKSKQASAEQDAAEAKKKQDAADKELQGKLAEVQKVTGDLNSKKKELEKADRGIAKFSDVEALFTQYDKEAVTFAYALDSAYEAVLNHDPETYDSSVALLDQMSRQLADTYKRITALFDDIRNKNY